MINNTTIDKLIEMRLTAMAVLEPSDINHKEPSGINQFKLKVTNTPGV